MEWGKSAIGAGRKAGFYNYVTQFVDVTEKKAPVTTKKYNNDLTRFIDKCKSSQNNKEDFEKLAVSLQSYLANFDSEFSIAKDYANVRGEDNHFKYIPLDNVLIRVSSDDTIFETVSRILAAKVAGVRFKVSIENNKLVHSFLANAKELFGSRDGLVEQNEKEMIRSIANFDRVIYSDISKVSDMVFKESSESLTFIVRQKPMMEGRLELLNYFIEQSISHSYHRYGNIGARELN